MAPGAFSVPVHLNRYLRPDDIVTVRGLGLQVGVRAAWRLGWAGLDEEVMRLPARMLPARPAPRRRRRRRLNFYPRGRRG